MRLAGFNFNKISIERKKEKPEKVKISSNIEISNIEEIEMKLANKNEKLLNVFFDYILNYEPEFANIEFKGSMAIIIDEKMGKEVLKKWKEKETLKDFKLAVLNVIFKKCNIKALQLEEELGLPLHMPLASLRPSN